MTAPIWEVTVPDMVPFEDVEVKPLDTTFGPIHFFSFRFIVEPYRKTEMDHVRDVVREFS